MPNTARLGLTLLSQSQGNKTAAINQNMVNLDALIYLSVVDSTHTAPPTSPTDQSVYIIAVGATGIWYGLDSQVAVYQAASAAWLYYVPKSGWIAYNNTTGLLSVFTGSVWGAVPSLAALTPTNNSIIIGNGTAWTTVDLTAAVTPIVNNITSAQIARDAYMWAMLAG